MPTPESVAGYCVVNDISEREFQIERSGGQWDKGKGFDTFGPIGPWLVTADEIADPQRLDMWLDVNGQRRQTGNTRTMIFGVAELVSYISRFFTLMPGDVIATGTPPGVGMGMKPPLYLKAGDVMRVGIAGSANSASRCWECRRIAMLRSGSSIVLTAAEPAGWMGRGVSRVRHWRALAPGTGLAGVLALAATFVSSLHGGPQLLYALFFGVSFHYLSHDPHT